MAANNYQKPEDTHTESEFEIETLNEKLIELLKTPVQWKLSETQRTQLSPKKLLCKNNHESSPEAHCCNSSPSLFHNKYDYTLLHHGSPANPKSFQHYLLPIGVFWDIENCKVPRGKSAAAVAQVIRDKFFNGYREAEFIVVCDVYKESKQVIQELNDAQVNLIHVAATYKNAADEKLKQSIRRFADIHGSLAAIILISSDINFAADLSDLRHRKKMHVILLHNENSSEALILCANEHYNFMELMESLPVRTPAKAPETYDLLVSNLPKDKGLTSIKRRLKQLSDNCGGRVIGINSNAAIIRFSLQESADRAQKRMNGELVFDTKITVKSLREKNNRKTKENSLIESTSETGVSGAAVSSPVPMYNSNSGIGGVRSLPSTPHYHSSSPVVGSFSGWNGVHCPPHPGMMPPAPMFMGRPYNSNGEIMYNRPYPEMSRVPSPVIWPSSTPHQFGRCWEELYKSDRPKNYGKWMQINSNRDGSSNGNHTPEGMRRIRGTHGSMNSSQDWNNIPRPNYCPMPMSINYSSGNFSQGNCTKRVSPSSMYLQGRDGNQRSTQNQYIPGRNTRTPSPYSNSSMQSNMPQPTCTSPYQSSVIDEDSEKFFNPINIRCPTNFNSNSNNSLGVPVELQVTNLDQNLDPKEMRRILYAIFMEHVMVHHISIFIQSDGNYAACVKLASISDAQYAISQLHRRKIGYKRILISYAHTGGPNPQLIKSQIVILLQEVPGHKLPLFKFREMYENRFMISVSVSELYKMKDVCIITDEPDGRMVSLNPDYRNTPSPCLENISQDGNLELPYCIIHTQKPWSEKGWAEQEMESLPNVIMSLKVLGARIRKLLTTHNGSLPLPTLPNCYEAEFNQSLDTNEKGVPLEHLISCLAFVEIKQGVGSVKYITWNKNKSDENPEETINKCISPPLVNQLALFSRELVDLLKTAPHCQIPFNRFIPAYHHHFGRQCRVADYGFTKLIDLLEALPQTIQVMGEGNKRMVTLSHRAQVRRFTSDLLRVLKAQASKQITLSDFPTVYTRVIAKPWNVVDYGVCEIGDILADVSENTVVVTDTDDGDKTIAIPKRDQTPQEIERTKQFANEAVELLRHAPQCTMLFNKFVPSYHHHFGHQCRVSDYGFSKLIELFEAIPHVITIEDGVDGGDRRISLTEPERFRVLGEQISKLISKTRNGLLLSNIAQSFLRQYGYMLRPEFYGCSSVEKLVEKLNNYVKVVNLPTGPTVMLIDKSQSQQLSLQCRRILMDQSQQRLTVSEFQRIYNQYYGNPCNIEDIKKLPDVVKISNINKEEYIELTPLQCFACNLYRVLIKHGGKLKLQQLESAYCTLIGSELKPSQYGFPSVIALLQALSCTVIIRESRNKKKTIFLNKKLGVVGISVPSTLGSPYRDRDSSNDSLGSESSRASLSQMARLHQWTSNNIQKTWSNKGSYWSNQPESSEESDKWPILKENGDNFLSSIIPRNSSTIMETMTSNMKPPESFSENEDDSEVWKSSVWATPPKYNQNNVDFETNINLPPLTLPTWGQADDDDSASSLLSPAKNLLSAAANPLNPITSPFFSSSHLVMAPHPSELPLPSLSLASKRSIFTIDQKKSEDKMQSTRLLGNSLEVHSPTHSESYNSTSEGEPSSDIIDSTPSKRFPGKRKLAAQFDHSINP
ncbi:meiosis regulator and mRNA stability factor 1 isoform X2 [Chelonus insularis]|uniref:meiosis regulator and mRNA stability factor 1 isoform X2 n=1 Tax=Chelonus insularis TaxID=460826 RepID=UPI00158B15D5|nr:meiosis regulator and mRNA stability factor 1 isoform X2 [Chelonus insularis]